MGDCYRCEVERAITAVVLRYPWAMDRGDLAGVAETMAGVEVSAYGPNGEVLSSASTRDRDELEAYYRRIIRIYDDGTPRTQHVVTGTSIELAPEGGAAGATSYLTVFQAVAPDLPLQPVLAGRYVDRYELVDGAWVLRSRQQRCDLVGDLSHHLMDAPL